MKILGYSERGAMNALFYGIALREDNKAMNEFLKLVGIDEEYKDFTLYSECSLSDFGNPDFVIIAKKNDNEKHAIFVEAKVSHGGNKGGKFSLDKQKGQHEKYLSNDNNMYNASNIFFQLQLKELFFSHLKDIRKVTHYDYDRNRIRYKKNREICREIGENVIVKKFACEIGTCISAYYIAIIPKCNEYEEPKEECFHGINIHFITWESIWQSSILKSYMKDTMFFNQSENQSEITNNPLPID